MFKSLKEKLSGWFKGEEKEEKPEKVKKPEKKPEKVKKEKAERTHEKKGAKLEKKKVEKTKNEVVKEVSPVKVEEPVPEKKKGFLGKIKNVFSEENEKSAVQEETVKEEAVPTSPKSETVEKVEARAEELREEIEKEAVEKSEPEPLKAVEVETEIEEKKGFFGKLARKLTASELSEKEFDEMFEELELALLENNVALDVVDRIKEKLREDLVGRQFTPREVEGKILGALKGAIDSVLIEPDNLLSRIKKSEKPFVILFFGINGSGKTTSIAKLAYKLKNEGLNIVVAAGDTFRAASIEQLETHANRIGVDIVKGEYGKDPASVAFDAIAYGKKNKKDVVLIDTAGRMYTRSNLMKEMEKIVKVSKPDLKIFVGESITGNDGTEQAKMFHETAGIDGIILSKADIDEKAGTILSVSYVTGKPIYFLGVGQEYEDLEEFRKENVLKHLGLD